MNVPHSKLQEAALLIQEGELVAFPTETVYGLGASVFNPEAIAKIFQIKGRPQDNPLIVHISSLDQLNLIVEKVPSAFYTLAKAFFPGPLTVILPKKEPVPASVSANLPTIGVRMPAHPVALGLIEAVGTPLVAPSANLSGKPSSTTAQHVYEDFGTNIPCILDGGPCQEGIESTVLTLEPEPLILRPGAITQAQLEHILNQPVALSSGHAEKPASPGMKYRHYAPQAKVILVSSLHEVKRRPKQMVLTEVQAHTLYALLRQADQEKMEEIVIVCDAKIKNNRALYNRITRASQ